MMLYKFNISSIYYRLLLLLVFLTFFKPLSAEETLTTELSGTIKNSKTKNAIPNVSITVPGTNIGTVTNADGFFILKIPEAYISNGIKADQIGYQSLFLSSKLFEGPLPQIDILMVPTGKVLKELLVLGGEPQEIVRLALKKIPNNYSSEDNLFSGFYRETVQKGNRFISISEGIVDVLKKPYNYRTLQGEKVRINKGRTLMSQKASDTISVKLMGGPYMPLQLDAVKNGDHLFTEAELDNFEFKMETPAMIDDRMHYSISFKPRVSLSYPLYNGTIFIDGETLAISRVEFALDMKDKSKVTQAILQKKPMGLHFKPLEVSGVVTYKLIDGKSYINYINSKIRFKCDWKKRLFSSTYTSQAEMVMVDRDNKPEKSLKFKESFGKRKIFSDQVDNYWDEDFWKEYNIIEPTESLEKAVLKLKGNP